MFQRVVTAQLGHAGALDGTGHRFDLRGLLHQLWTQLKLLGKVTRIRMAETLLESVCDQFGFLERGLTIGRRSQLINELMPLVHRHLVDAIKNLGATRGEAGNLDDITFFALPLLRLPLLAKPAFPVFGRITDNGQSESPVSFARSRYVATEVLLIFRRSETARTERPCSCVSRSIDRMSFTVVRLACFRPGMAPLNR
ncbi:hypothetical protein A6U97_26510 [Agrobacterium tumefaciens]|nr:hypothetical protein A6U97_26510 [Agrobacterium tumefaciens]